jgi:hypothetical protein
MYVAASIVVKQAAYPPLSSICLVSSNSQGLKHQQGITDSTALRATLIFIKLHRRFTDYY